MDRRQEKNFGDRRIANVYLQMGLNKYRNEFFKEENLKREQLKGEVK